MKAFIQISMIVSMVAALSAPAFALDCPAGQTGDSSKAKDVKQEEPSKPVDQTNSADKINK